MPAYKMTAYPRGLALIIEIEEFVNNVEKPRIGSHVSFYKLLFQNYKVIIIVPPPLYWNRVNQSAKQMVVPMSP